MRICYPVNVRGKTTEVNVNLETFVVDQLYYNDGDRVSGIEARNAALTAAFSRLLEVLLVRSINLNDLHKIVDTPQHLQKTCRISDE